MFTLNFGHLLTADTFRMIHDWLYICKGIRPFASNKLELVFNKDPEDSKQLLSIKAVSIISV